MSIPAPAIDGASDWRLVEVPRGNGGVEFHVLATQDGHTYVIHSGYSKRVAELIAVAPILLRCACCDNMSDFKVASDIADRFVCDLYPHLCSEETK